MSGVFSVVRDHEPKAGLTISSPSGLKAETGVNYFSLGAGTDISSEKYDRPVIYFGLYGHGVYQLGSGREVQWRVVRPGEILMTPENTLCRKETADGCVYAEIMPGKEIQMNEAVKAGEVFQLGRAVPYEKGSVVNMDVASNDQMKFVVMAFDEGTGLSPHSAPGDALVFALEGKAVIGYEGKEYPIEAGENFRFEKGGIHSIQADGKFKMALLLLLA
ncbi:MAG: cupin domain-containing protein [Lachnospiraceae bacterium]|jgi:quercetin dioxygenase-like cupin family protein|nr:cupin domain-containing protein [Lachnospiraceae bacterium]